MKGYGRIHHTPGTQRRIEAMARELAQRKGEGDGVEVYEALRAADRFASAAMWLVVHETYARSVYMDGRPLRPEDFKAEPEGHTGGALNMVPAYVGYLVINALTGLTRAWIMGQGHCVAAIDSANLLVGNTTPAHRERSSGLMDDRTLRSAATSMPTPPAVLPREGTWGSWNCSTCTCPWPASAWWCS
jgi:phosphoketolase